VRASLIHVSDLHFDDVAPRSVEDLLRAIAELHPTAVIVSGDLTMRGAPGEFRSARAFLERIEAPVVCVPGNHDVPAYNLLERFARPFRRYRRCVEGVASSRFESGDVALLGLNTARSWGLHWNWAHGRFSRAQIREMDAWFAERSQAHWRGLVAHHPFEIPPGMRSFRPVGRAGAMLRRLGERSVHFILTGHLHRGMLSLTSLDGENGWTTAMLHAPTATSPRLRGEANAFNRIELRPDDAAISRWEHGESGFAEVRSTELARTVSGLRGG